MAGRIAGRERITKNHAEVDVLAFVGDVFSAHEFFDFEELGEVEILLGGDDVDHFTRSLVSS